MPRIAQRKARKGSQRCLQYLVNQSCEVLDGPIREHLRLDDSETIDWLSPLEEDAFAEYSDDEFLARLSILPDKTPLSSFWPRGGPVWDGLAETSRGDILLVEAKSHVSELSSSCEASPKSLAQIRNSMATAAAHYGSEKSSNWAEVYYQYANRLSHLYLLRNLNGLPAWLVFLYFTNDREMAGPKSAVEWQHAIDAVHLHLGIGKQVVEPYVFDIFIDSGGLAQELGELQKW